MARKNNDKDRLAKAVYKRRLLIESKEFGPPTDNHRNIGIVVAVATSANDKSQDYVEHTEEAESILELSRKVGYDAEVKVTDNRNEALGFISNRALTDLVFIGHGHLAQLDFDEQKMNWWHIARSLDHLKQGFVIQRHCGVRWNKMNIALGTFAVSNMMQVIAPVGEVFQPLSLKDDNTNSLLMPVYLKSELTHSELLEIGTAEYDD